MAASPQFNLILDELPMRRHNSRSSSHRRRQLKLQPRRPAHHRPNTANHILRQPNDNVFYLVYDTL